MPQEVVVVGYEQEYPGSTSWPIKAYKCPVCEQFKQNCGNVDELQENGEWYRICEDCEEPE